MIVKYTIQLTVFGYGYFSILGIEFGIFEILLGYKYIRYTFTDLESEYNIFMFIGAASMSQEVYI